MKKKFFPAIPTPTPASQLFKYVADAGMGDPDKGKGGKYVFLPPNYKRDALDEYFVVKSFVCGIWAVRVVSLRTAILYMLFRLYGLEQAWFDKTCRPSEVELIK